MFAAIWAAITALGRRVSNLEMAPAPATVMPGATAVALASPGPIPSGNVVLIETNAGTPAPGSVPVGQPIGTWVIGVTAHNGGATVLDVGTETMNGSGATLTSTANAAFFAAVKVSSTNWKGVSQ